MKHHLSYPNLPVVLRATLTVWALLLFAATTPVASAGSDVVWGTDNGAMDGYDPVAYHTVGRPAKGDPALTFEWKGATWRFVSQENRAAFIADPAKYTPAFGGNCAVAMADGGKMSNGNPHQWQLAHGKLYLNGSARALRGWKRKGDSGIRSANRHWRFKFPKEDIFLGNL